MTTDTDPWIAFATRTIPTPRHVYLRRRLCVLVVLAVVVLTVALAVT